MEAIECWGTGVLGDTSDDDPEARYPASNRLRGVKGMLEATREIVPSLTVILGSHRYHRFYEHL